MIVDPSALEPADMYRWLISSIIPRPIAFVSTQSKHGITNLAPFSYFQAIGHNPPMLVFAVHQKRAGDMRVKKDTLRNIEETSEFVVNIASDRLVDQVNQSAANYPPDVSEIDEVGLTPVASDLIRPPRIAECPIQFECKTERILMLGHAPQFGLVIGEVVRMHVADEVLADDKTTVSPEKLRPLARLGGSLYATLGDIIERARPK